MNNRIHGPAAGLKAPQKSAKKQSVNSRSTVEKPFVEISLKKSFKGGFEKGRKGSVKWDLNRTFIIAPMISG